MSFSTELKKELSELNNLSNKEEVKCELLGYILSGNCIVQKNKLKYSTENEYNINRFSKLLRNVNINGFNIEIQGKIFVITIKKYDEMIEILREYLENINELKDLQKSVVRGLFLGSGSINNPESQYHLEFSLNDTKYIELFANILENADIKAKINDKSLYIKDGEELSKFLAFIGAGKSVIKFEEIRVQRHMNNKINRLVNCKTANLNKVINASVEQIDAIKKLKQSGEFNKLDESLKEIAELRLEHPDMPLSELGSLLKKPIGKSGVNYRLKKIVELAK